MKLHEIHTWEDLAIASAECAEKASPWEHCTLHRYCGAHAAVQYLLVAAWGQEQIDRFNDFTKVHNSA